MIKYVYQHLNGFGTNVLSLNSKWDQEHEHARAQVNVIKNRIKSHANATTVACEFFVY